MNPIILLMLVLCVGFIAYLLYSGQFKWLLGVFRNMALGVVGILIINAIFSEIAVGINVITALVVGLLCVPGLLLLYAAQVLVG